MTKSTKHKNILQQLADIDAQQQARTMQRSKKSKRKTSKDTITLSSREKTILIILSVAFPWIGWAIGALINPTGWASGDPSVVLQSFMIYSIIAWFISIPLAIFIIYFLIKRQTGPVLIIVFLTSLVMSLIILSSTATASEDEFTG